LEPDFAAQKGEIQETIEAAGHLLLFYPLFDYELNFIQYYWDATKHFTRQNCGFDFPCLKRWSPGIGTGSKYFDFKILQENTTNNRCL